MFSPAALRPDAPATFTMEIAALRMDGARHIGQG